MGTEPRRFFVIGYPRSRTAWLSVLLHGDGVVCLHEGSGGRGAAGVEDLFAEWAAPIMGLCDSGLLFSVEALMETYPDAYWLIVHRPSGEALSSIMADRPYEAASWQERWPEAEDAMGIATALLSGGCRTLEVEYADIDRRLYEIYAHLTGQVLCAHKVANLKGLKITQIPPPPGPAVLSVRFSEIERMGSLGFDLTGLSVRPFVDSCDLLLFAEWCQERELEGAKLAPYLPPLGVVVEDAEGPVAFLFCRESYGIPAADLEFSVTRPGLTLKASGAAMAFAVAACIDLAGQLVVPQANYNLFRVTCSPPLGRFVARLGFVPHGRDDCQKYLYQKT